jgi:DNA helicase-2/ATP-dependent DNA helicase PcrA
VPNEFRCWGPPGTGKTTWLSKQIVNAVEKHGPDAVLVGSFTRAAAHELAGRDLPLDREHVGTLHAHAFRALDHPPLVERKHLKLWNADHPDFALSDGWTHEELSDRGGEGSPGDPYLGQWDVARARQRSAMQHLHDADLQKFAVAWTEWKRELGLLDFTDLIETALREVPVAPGAPRIGFFDEVQDFTQLELALVRQWAEEMEYVVLAGDDDQCIYQFKGASPEAFLDPPVDQDHKRILAQSYRLPRRVHAYAERMVHQLGRREPKVYAPRDAEGDIRHLAYSLHDGYDLAGEVERALDQYQTVMVLTACGYMLRYPDGLLAALKEAGIPYHNPYAPHQGGWNPLRAAKGKLTPTQRLLAYLKEPWTGLDVAAWAPLLEAEGVFRRGCKQILASWSDPSPVPLPYLRDYLHDGAVDLLARDVDWFQRHATKDAKAKLAYPVAVATAQGAEALTTPSRVVVGTIHSVKGGEADCVLLFPDVSYRGYQEQQTPQGEDAAIRQFYVGMTRAREALWIGTGTWPQVELP